MECTLTPTLSRRTGRGGQKRITLNSLAGGLVFLFTFSGVAGCKVGPKYRKPELPLPDRFANEVAAAQTVDLARWWTAFNDPLLDSLIERAAESNLDLRLAEARLLEARALRGVTAAGSFPNVNVGAGYTRSRGSENAFGDFGGGGTDAGGEDGEGGGIPGGGTAGGSTGAFALPGEQQSFYQAGFDASWELDFFGRVRRSVEAAEADIEAAVEGRRDALVTLMSEVARNYLELRGYQRQLAIARRNLEAQRQTLELTEVRAEAEVVSDLDVARARAQVSTTESQLPTFQSQRDRAAHRLAVLLGQEPGALLDELAEELAEAEEIEVRDLAGEDAGDEDEAGEGEGDAVVVREVRIPSGPPEVPAGLPSELLRRRPDVRRAERQLAAATARVGVATADLFPRFTLTGALGVQSQQFKDLGSLDSRFWSVGPSVSWPIFDAGRIRANIRVQNARQEVALVQYEVSVLTALEDVENALVAHANEQERRRSLQAAVEANRLAVELASQLYARGVSDFLDVLEAQRSLFASEDALAESDRTVSTNLVALYKALGGGWEGAEGATDATNTAATR